jgi:dienelactone hydrolase
MVATIREEWVIIDTSRGLRLGGELLVPAGRGPHPAVVFAHGLGGSKESPRNRGVAEALRSRGIAILLFDFTGHGDSEGRAEDCTPAQQADDIRSVLDFLLAIEEVDTARVGLLGSNGVAGPALTVAADRPEVHALVLRAGRVAGAEELAARVTAPTLLVVGERDTRCQRDNERLLARMAGERCLAVVPCGDPLDDSGAFEPASDVIAAWFARHLAQETGREVMAAA